MFRSRDIPNIISVARILLSLPLAYLLLQERYGEAIGLYFIAGISDALDGYLAKSRGWFSRLGSILDPLADKVLLLTTYLALGWDGVLPMWLVLMVIGRDVVIVSGALAYHVLIGSYDMAPTWISKVNTTLQIILGLAVVVSLGLVALPAAMLAGLIYAVGISTAISGVDYVWTWSKKARLAYASKKRL